MRKLKKILLIVGLAAVVVAVGLLGTWLYIGRAGSTGVEAWIGRHLIEVVESHVTPRVSFTRLDYQRPRTVIIENLALSAHGHTILSADRLLLELAEVPHEGRPVRIERIHLDNPNVVLAEGPAGGMIGWSEFVRPEVRQDPKAVPPGRRLSNVLVLREVLIRGGEARYQPAGESEPMVLPGIDVALHTSPDAHERGWYLLGGKLTLAPILDASIDGQINLDTGDLNVREALLNAALGERQYDVLPPRVRQLLRRHAAQGELSARFAGQIPLRAPARTTGVVEATLRHGHVALANADLTAAGVHVRAQLPDGPAALTAEVPAFSQAGRSLISADRIRLELAALPDSGPVHIRRLEADRPRGELVRRPDGSFAGWSEIGDPDAQESPAKAATAAPRPDPNSDPPVNRVVRVDEAEIRDGDFLWQDQGSGQTVDLRKINLTLQPPEPGHPWQMVALSTRGDQVRATVDGRIDLSSLVLDTRRLLVQAEMGHPAIDALLPEAVADLRRRHDIRADLRFTFEGRVPLADVAAAGGRARAELADLRLQFAGLQMPVEAAALTFTLPAGEIDADIRRLRLTSGGHPVASIESLQVQLASPPSPGQPLDVHLARLDQPRLHFVRTPGKGLLGWSSLINPDTPFPKISDFARFRRMEIDGGEVLYDDTGDDSPPMLLTGIDARLDTPPVAGSPGWYHMNIAAHKENLMDLSLRGRLNPDRMILDFERFDFGASLGERQYGTLPPQIQAVLRRHEVRGRLDLRASGRAALDDPLQSRADFEANVRDARIAFEDTVWPIQSVRLNGRLDRGAVQADYAAAVLGGTASGDFALGLTGRQPARLRWDIRQVRMEDTLRIVQAGPPKYSGRVDSQGTLTVELDTFPDTLHGTGTLDVRNARLVNLPVIRTLVDVVSGAGLGLSPRQPDSAAVSFDLRPDHVALHRLLIDSEAIRLEGGGRIYYDEHVDLDVNARIAEKVGRGIGQGLGRLAGLGRVAEDLGDAVGDVTGLLALGERAVTYRVSGDLSNPQISVGTLGLLGGR